MKTNIYNCLSSIKGKTMTKKQNELVNKLKKAEDTTRSKAMKNRAPFEGMQIKPTASFFNNSEKQEVGKDNWSRFGFDINPQVMFISTIFLAIFICLNLML
jgi:hypothetical protein